MINNAQVFQGLQGLTEFFLEPKYAYSTQGCSNSYAKPLSEVKRELLSDLSWPLPGRAEANVKCDYQLVREGVDPIAVLDHLDNIVRLVGAKLTAMQANPDAAFDRAELDESDVLPMEASSASSFRELYDWFEKINESMNTIGTLLPDLSGLDLKWNHLQQQCNYYFRDLIQAMQDTVALSRQEAKAVEKN